MKFVCFLLVHLLSRVVTSYRCSDHFVRPLVAFYNSNIFIYHNLNVTILWRKAGVIKILGLIAMDFFKV